MDGISHLTDMPLGKLWETVKDREAWICTIFKENLEFVFLMDLPLDSILEEKLESKNVKVF